MQYDAVSAFPPPTASVSSWETFLRQCLQRKSTLRVRSTRHGESPALREQQFLKRLKSAAQHHLHKPALAEIVPPLQRQVLNLIQLRRELIPDDSPAWNQAEVFLAVAELHRSLHHLLDRIDQVQSHYQSLTLLLEHSLQLHAQLIHGSLRDSAEIHSMLRGIRMLTADQSIVPACWLGLCSPCAEYETGLAHAFQRKSLASSLLTTYLVTQILHREHWLIDTESVLIASLFKDAGWLIGGASEKNLARGQHAEWSAGLILQVMPHSAAVPRLIRQHHECLDGTGLPFGQTATHLRRDARLLSLVTRWAELYIDQLPSMSPLEQLTDTAVQRPCHLLISETLAGRWDTSWLGYLLQSLGYSSSEFAENARNSHNANPHWHIPRPHFLKKSAIPQQQKSHTAR